jgi:hypothetical protein
VLDVACILHGVPKDQLDGKDIRQRKRVRHIGASVAALLALFVLAAVPSPAAVLPRCPVTAR